MQSQPSEEQNKPTVFPIDKPTIPPQFLGIPTGLNEKASQLSQLSSIFAEQTPTIYTQHQQLSMRQQPATLDTEGIINAELADEVRQVYGDDYFESLKVHQLRMMDLDYEHKEFAIQNATMQRDHRMNLENAASKRLERGQWIGLSILLLSWIVAGLFAYSGHILLGTIIVGSTGSAGLVTTLLTGYNKIIGKGDKKDKKQAGTKEVAPVQNE